MIKVTRINKVDEFYVNEELIEFMEETPDTILAMESGKKVVVMETAQQVIALMLEQKQRLLKFRDQL